jgi:ABC-type Mn2+/Zn2+ transport system ATPase subunit
MTSLALQTPAQASRSDTPALAAHPSAPVLEVRNLHVRYGPRLGLEDVTFAVWPGERLAVVGPNAAGKTTLFRAVAGIIEPWKGEVVVHGHEPGVDVCVAYVPQRNQVDWAFPVSVAEVVMMGRVGSIGLFHRARRLDWQVVHDCLAAVELDSLAQRHIGELSGGQQQRMFIARALAQQAELVLMDEPFSGLDVPSQQAMLAVLDSLRASGVSLMVATHDLELAAQSFDRVMLLKQRLIGIGLPEQVFTEANLVEAYGGRVRLLDGHGERVAVGDTCCDDEPGLG